MVMPTYPFLAFSSLLLKPCLHHLWYPPVQQQLMVSNKNLCVYVLQLVDILTLKQEADCMRA